MSKDKRNIILAFIIGMLFMGGTFSFAYFLMDIIGTGSDLSKLSTGTLELNINDESVNISNLEPIDDNDYENYAYKKEFEIINSGTLNGCSDIYLDITSISESLKSKYFKYKLVSNTGIYTGDFTKVENNRLLLAKESMVESNITKKYTLYIWLSYDENENQNDLLETSINGTLSIENKDCNIKYKPTDYIMDSAVLVYDAEYNTSTGHDDTSTTIYDWSVNSNIGTLNGPVWGSNYLSFDGVDDWVSIGEHNYNLLTMEVVFSFDTDNSSEQTILSNFNMGGYGFTLTANQLYSYIYVSNYKSIATSKLEVNKLYSISSSYNNSTLNLYTNSVLFKTLNVSGPIGVPTNSTILVLGANPGGSKAETSYFKGKIYSVRLYNRALTEEEIKHNYEIDKARFGL